MNATIRLYAEQMAEITRALALLHMEDALISTTIAEDSILVATIETHSLRAVADIVHESDPDLAKSIRRLDTKIKKQAAAEWLRSKFGL